VVGSTADPARGISPRGEAADPEGLGDGAVADVGVGVFGSVACKVESLDVLRGADEPAVSETAYANAEVYAVAGHCYDDAAAGDVRACKCDGFGCCHGGIEVEVVVLGDEAQYGGCFGA